MYTQNIDVRICISTSWKKSENSQYIQKIKKKTGHKFISEKFKICNCSVAAIKKRNSGITIKAEAIGSTSNLPWCSHYAKLQCYIFIHNVQAAAAPKNIAP